MDLQLLSSLLSDIHEVDEEDVLSDTEPHSEPHYEINEDLTYPTLDEWLSQISKTAKKKHIGEIIEPDLKLHAIVRWTTRSDPTWKPIWITSNKTERLPTLEILNIAVDYRIKSVKDVYNKFLERVENLSKKYNRHIYVEAVLDQDLIEVLIKRKYKEDRDSNNYWKFLKIFEEGKKPVVPKKIQNKEEQDETFNIDLLMSDGNPNIDTWVDMLSGGLKYISPTQYLTQTRSYDMDTGVVGFFRWTDRFIPKLNEKVKTIEIAEVGIDEKLRGKGNFSRFLDKIENYGKSNDRYIYVESVMNPKLDAILIKRGYDHDDSMYKNYWKKP